MTPYYEHGGITIYHGDCRDVLPKLGTFDLLMADPPYGIGAARKGFNSGLGVSPQRDYGDADWDDQPADIYVLRAAKSMCENAVIWGGNYFDLGPARCYLVWDKLRDGDTGYADAELAWTNLKSTVRIIRWKWHGFIKEAPEDRYHPTQKPIAVIKWAIAQAPEGKSVLDPYMGSGTTLRAAKDMGFTAVGIEREERYCEIAAKRLSQEVLAFGT